MKRAFAPPTSLDYLDHSFKGDTLEVFDFHHIQVWILPLRRQSLRGAASPLGRRGSSVPVKRVLQDDGLAGPLHSLSLLHKSPRTSKRKHY